MNANLRIFALAAVFAVLSVSVGAARGFGGFRGGGFGGGAGGFDFHNDAPQGFGDRDFGSMPQSFNRSNFDRGPQSGNYTFHHSTTATNAWGQTYHSGTYVHDGNVYHGATISNPVYGGYGAWGWNGGVAWYPAPYYWGGGFWGPFAAGAVTAAAFGSVYYDNNTYTSYQVEPQSPGAKLLSSYNLTQTPCGPPNLVVIYGQSNSVICARPNNLVAAGNYNVNPNTLTIVSQQSS